VLADFDQPRSLTVSDRDHETTVYEEKDFAQLDYLYGIDITSRLQDHKERVVIDIELGSLMGMDGVLHRQLMQTKLLPHRFEFLLGGFVEPDPTERLAALALLERFLQSEGLGPALAIGVEGGVDDHWLKVARGSSATCSRIPDVGTA
jgi:hypothetical protein